MNTTKGQSTKKKRKILKTVLEIIAVGVIGVVGYAAYKLWPKEISVSLDSGSDPVVVSVSSSIDPENLKDKYQVVIYDRNNKVHSYLHFDGKTKEVSYSKSHLMDGEKYTFVFERIDRKQIDKLTYRGNMVVDMPIIEIEEDIVMPTIVSIASVSEGVPDYNKKVWNRITIVMVDNDKSYQYSIGEKRQSTPVFNNIKPGTYTIVVKDEQGNEDSQEIVLPAINPKGDALTLPQVQSIIDKVSSGDIEPSDAQGYLANGNVNLAKPVSSKESDNIKTLWGVLTEAKWGTKFKVESFQVDLNTNKIKSGTLKISVR